MQRTGQGSPEMQMKAESYVATGYQRLLTFEAPDGGFSLMGYPPAQVFLSAYGLMHFHDMAQVYPVDEAVMERAVQWLFQQQQRDGTWQTSDYRAGQGPLGATAYVTWALVQAGYEDTSQVGLAIEYIRSFASKEADPYSLALAANALAAYDPKHAVTRAVIDQLYGMRVVEGEVVYWRTSGGSYMGATGKSGSVETTALATMAFLEVAAYPDAVSGALAYLIQAKDAWGIWDTTQATILSLKALLLASGAEARASGPAMVRVSLNGEQTQEMRIDESNADVVHVVTFAHDFSPTGDDSVQIELEGGGNLMYQVSTRYYLPWPAVPVVPAGEEIITIDLAYDRTTLAVNDEVTVDVQIKLNVAGVVKLALVDLGVPPGFTVLTEDLSALVAKGVIARYELMGRQIIVYLEDLVAESPLRFSYRLRARFPLRAKVPPSLAYDYYNPTGATVRAPLEVRVDSTR